MVIVKDNVADKDAVENDDEDEDENRSGAVVIVVKWAAKNRLLRTTTMPWLTIREGKESMTTMSGEWWR